MKRTKSAARIAWHVMDRGTRRLALYRDNEDFLKFLSILAYAVQAVGCVLWAYTIMSNHYHLVIYATSDELADCMRRLNQMYSAYHNEKYGHTGTAFEGPYKAYPQRSPFWLLRTIAYVFLNPIVAGFPGGPEDYPWSCYRCYAGLPGSPLRVDPSAVMAHISPDPKSAWDLFWKAMDREANRPAKKPAGHVSMTDAHANQFEWLLEHARERRGEFEGLRATVVAMYWGRQCGITPKAMARVLEEPDTGKVRDSLYRLSKKIERDQSLADRLRSP